MKDYLSVSYLVEGNSDDDVIMMMSCVSFPVREDVGMFGRRVGIRYSMKKLIDLQSRIEGWEVSISGGDPVIN